MEFPYRFEIDTKNQPETAELGVNWFIIKNISKLQGIIRKEFYSENDKTIYLFSRHEKDLNNGAQIFVHLFDLPENKIEFEQCINNYKENEDGFLLTNKKKPQQNYLQLLNSDFELFETYLFQVKDGRYRKRIVHVYEQENKGILIVYSLNDNKFIENTFFKLFTEVCEIRK